MTPTATTQSTLQELLGRLGQPEPDPVAELFAESVEWDVPGDELVPWTGARSTREEIAAYFKLLWSVLDTSQADTAVSHVFFDDADAVVLGVFTQTIRASGRRFATHVALHITVRDDGLITRFRLYEDSHAVSRAFADRD
jgi:uncharacterized protein